MSTLPKLAVAMWSIGLAWSPIAAWAQQGQTLPGPGQAPTMAALLNAGYRISSHAAVQHWFDEGDFTNTIGGQNVSWPLIRPREVTYSYVLNKDRSYFVCTQDSRATVCRSLN